MSCHYSCSTCISYLFADQCLSCPTTRQLIDTTCICASSYFYYQYVTCRTYSYLSRPDYAFYIMTNVLYWVMVAFSWLIILGNLNHLYSAKIRVLVGWSQLIALLLYYRFRFTILSQQSLEVFAVWNFSYFDRLFCTQRSKPYQCYSYQNIYGPLFTLAAFIIAMIVSYLFTKTCILSMFAYNQDYVTDEATKGGDVLVVNRSKYSIYKTSYTSNSSIKQMTFSQYLKISLKQFLFLYLDYTIIQWTLQLSRIAYLSTYLFVLIYIPILVFLLLYSLYALKVINSTSQFKVEYRSQFGYFYIYDQKYYLNYLDYLFYEEREARDNYDRKNNRNNRKRNNRNYNNHNDYYYYEPKRYLPHSSYLILYIFIKFIIASTTIIMFYYKPQLWVFPSLVVLLIAFIKLKVFQVYYRLALLCYLVGFLVYLLSVALYFVEYFFNIWIIILVLSVSAAFFVLLVNYLIDWNRAKEGKYWAVAFYYLEGETYDYHQENNQYSENQDNILEAEEYNSQDEIIKSRNNNDPNRIVKSGYDLKDNSDQHFNNFARNIIVANAPKPSSKNNLNSTQKNSLSNTQNNLNIMQIISNLPKDTYSQRPQTNQNAQQLPRQYSFMTLSNRSKQTGFGSQNSFSNSKLNNNSTYGNSLGMNDRNNRKGENYKLPEIAYEDRQDSVDGKSNQDLKLNTNQNDRKPSTNAIQYIESNQSDHYIHGRLIYANQPQENLPKMTGKFKNFSYKKR